VFDFGRLEEGATRFLPVLYSYSNNFNGFVGKNEAVRYELELDATNFFSPRPQVFEVAWDGQWSTDPEAMQHHLRITEFK
jgi:hypothetical protein